MAECNDFDDVCLKNLFAEKMKVVEYCKENVPNKCQENSTYLNGRTRGINQISYNFTPLIAPMFLDF